MQWFVHKKNTTRSGIAVHDSYPGSWTPKGRAHHFHPYDQPGIRGFSSQVQKMRQDTTRNNHPKCKGLALGGYKGMWFVAACNDF